MWPEVAPRTLLGRLLRFLLTLAVSLLPVSPTPPCPRCCTGVGQCSLKDVTWQVAPVSPHARCLLAPSHPCATLFLSAGSVRRDPRSSSHEAAPALHWLRRRTGAKGTGPRDCVYIEIVPRSGVSCTVRPGQVLKLPLFSKDPLLIVRVGRDRAYCARLAPTAATSGAFPGGTQAAFLGGCPGALYSTRRGSFPARKSHH